MTDRDFTITQGKTFNPVIRWGARPYLYKAIASIAKAAPMRVVTQAAHEIPNGWPACVVSAQGMTEANAALDEISGMPALDAYHTATVVNGTTVDFDDVNAADFTAHVANSGYIQLFTPVNLTGYTARMTIRDRIGGTALETMTTENGKIVIDVTAKTITPTLTAAATAAYTWRRGVYDLELIDASGNVHEVLRGRISVAREATT